MTHIKRQKLISSTQVRGYRPNTQFLLYPQALSWWIRSYIRDRLAESSHTDLARKQRI